MSPTEPIALCLPTEQRRMGLRYMAGCGDLLSCWEAGMRGANACICVLRPHVRRTDSQLSCEALHSGHTRMPQMRIVLLYSNAGHSAI